MSSETPPTWVGPFHRRVIARGDYGELSKIEEERQEALDALEQGQHLMLLVEAADMLGALRGWLEVHHPQVKLDAPTYVPKLTRSEFDQRAADVLAALEPLCAPSFLQPAQRAARIVSQLVVLAAPFNMTFADLDHFATLRSAVARHALQGR